MVLAPSCDPVFPSPLHTDSGQLHQAANFISTNYQTSLPELMHQSPATVSIAGSLVGLS
jgi:hypothetical protein